MSAMLASELDLLGGSVNSHHAVGCGAFNDRLGDNAASAAHIKPSQTGGRRQPAHKFLRQQTAPAPHPTVVVRTRSPSIHAHRFILFAHQSPAKIQRTMSRVY